ncbi:MAG: DUF3306 domain-containing protein [Gammaproteobacteria bacterium]|nr:DUF3306 domain-containing protein [Gammaproteobacteria bacterium]MDH3536463.1 DUF3306 domain-containing protein [Gammaproteobacteria bacterium]
MTRDSNERDSNESVLSRWSRRKRETDRAPQQAPEPAELRETAADLPPAEVEAAAQPVLTDADMPAIESLDESSDFSGFMSAGVSDELRNLALRKLFRAPVFNIRDGLDEYDDDYTSFEKLGDIVTSDMRHRIEMEEQKLREKLAAEGEVVGEQPDESEAVDGVDDAGEAAADDAAQPATTVAAADPTVKPGKTAADEQ